MYKKKKLIKEKTSNKKYSKLKKSKVKRTKSRSSLALNPNDDEFEDLYIKTNNKMHQKNRKIQVIDNKMPYYYMDESIVASNELNNYNYNNNNEQKHNSQRKRKRNSNILWIE